MTKQLHSNAPEPPQKIAIADLTCISCALGATQILAQKEGIRIPFSFIKEIERFALRNSLADINLSCICCKKPVRPSCESCLKAHITKKAGENSLSKEARDFMLDIIEAETGHHGYYLDQNKLIKI